MPIACCLLDFLLSMRKFLPPGSVIEADQCKKGDKEENIEENITYSNSFFDKEKPEINTHCHIDHHPGNAVKNGPGNFF